MIELHVSCVCCGNLISVSSVNVMQNQEGYGSLAKDSIITQHDWELKTKLET